MYVEEEKKKEKAMYAASTMQQIHLGERTLQTPHDFGISLRRSIAK